MSPRLRKTELGLLLAVQAIPLVAYSQTYLTEDGACQAIFPDEKFTRKQLALSPDDVKKIESAGADHVRDTKVIVLVGDKKDSVIIDQALGKHEFITYAVGIDASGAIRGVEILEYRETYGYQVKEKTWTKQFTGKTAASPLKLNQEIVNISGATLSSMHLTNGVRRVLQTYEVLKSRL
jgi:Na+-translocating ferredoxin:NAD+ oxidoreductase RnfG subunit